MRTRIVPTRDLPFAELRAIFGALRAEAGGRLLAEGFGRGRQRFEERLEMRYAGQAFELSVELPARCRSMPDVEKAFRSVHERRYAHATDAPMEIVSLRLSAYGALAKPCLGSGRPSGSRGSRRGRAPERSQRRAVFEGRWRRTPVFWRADLTQGQAVSGPAFIEEPGSTTVVPPGFRTTADGHGNLILER